MCAQAVEHCIAAARHQTAALPKSGAHDSSKPAQAPMSRSSSFAAAVLTRLARRGHVSLIAQSAWKAVCKTPAADPVNSGHPAERDLGGSPEGRSASPGDALESSVEDKALSDRRGSHAEASTLHGSSSAANRPSRIHQSRNGTATSLHQMPSAGQDACSETKDVKERVAATELMHREEVRFIQQLLCQITDSQALEKILAALLLEAPVNNAGTVAQVCP